MRIAMLACTFGLAATSAAWAQTPKLEKTRIALSVGGSISQMNKIAYFVALNRKYFALEGLDVESTAFASGTAALQNLIGGNADVVEGSFEHTLRMQTKGQHLMCIAVFGRYPANVLVVRKSQADKIKTIADLRAKKIGISAPGSSTHNFVAGLMERAGVNHKEASYISVGTGLSAVAAMRSGAELDAVVNLDPAINALVDTATRSCSPTAAPRKAPGGVRRALSRRLPLRQDRLREAKPQHRAGDRQCHRPRDAMAEDGLDRRHHQVAAAEYYQADEKLYRKSLEKNLAAFQWDGIVTNEAVMSVWNAISVLEPDFKAAKIEMEKTYDNQLIERALAKYKAPLKE